MAQISVCTHLSREGALKARSMEVGHIHVTPTAEEVAAVSDEQAAEVAKHVADCPVGGGCRSYNVLETSAPGWPGVVQAIDRALARHREAMAQVAAQAAAKAQKREAGLALWNGWSHEERVKRVSTRNCIDGLTECQWPAGLDRDAFNAGFGPAASHTIATFPGGQEVLAEISRIRTEEKAAAEARQKAAAEKAEAEARAKEAAKVARLAALAAWIREHGTTGQRERLGAGPGTHPLGLLPQDEAIDAVKAALFPDWPEFQRLIESDLSEGTCEYGHDVSYDSEDAEDVPAVIWEATAKMRKALAEAPLSDLQPVGTIRVHTAECDRRGCTAEARRYGYRVVITWRGWELSREYAVPSEGGEE